MDKNQTKKKPNPAPVKICEGIIDVTPYADILHRQMLPDRSVSFVTVQKKKNVSHQAACFVHVKPHCVTRVRVTKTKLLPLS